MQRLQRIQHAAEPSATEPSLTYVQRVLDLDLDFFVHGVEHWLDRDHGRLDASEFPAWSVEDTLAFLHERCGLTGRLPGFVVEHHGELFTRWGDAIDAGLLRAPFHLTHVDAHADIGLGDAGYMHLMTKLLFRAPEDRRDPGEHLEDGNYLIFAVGCRWLSALDYIYNRDDDGDGPGDILGLVMEGRRHDADHIQLAAFSTRRELEDLVFGAPREPAWLEPRVPFRGATVAPVHGAGAVRPDLSGTLAAVHARELRRALRRDPRALHRRALTRDLARVCELGRSLSWRRRTPLRMRPQARRRRGQRSPPRSG